MSRYPIEEIGRACAKFQALLKIVEHYDTEHANWQCRRHLWLLSGYDTVSISPLLGLIRHLHSNVEFKEPSWSVFIRFRQTMHKNTHVQMFPCIWVLKCENGPLGVCVRRVFILIFFIKHRIEKSKWLKGSLRAINRLSGGLKGPLGGRKWSSWDLEGLWVRKRIWRGLKVGYELKGIFWDL